MTILVQNKNSSERDNQRNHETSHHDQMESNGTILVATIYAFDQIISKKWDCNRCDQKEYYASTIVKQPKCCSAEAECVIIWWNRGTCCIQQRRSTENPDNKQPANDHRQDLKNSIAVGFGLLCNLGDAVSSHSSNCHCPDRSIQAACYCSQPFSIWSIEVRYGSSQPRLSTLCKTAPNSHTPCILQVRLTKIFCTNNIYWDKNHHRHQTPARQHPGARNQQVFQRLLW